MFSTWVLAAAIAPTWPAPPGPETVGRRAAVHQLDSSAFRIPIKLSDQRPQQIESLRLFASTDQGLTWVPAATAVPDDREFEFQATQPGEHWFTLQIRWKDGRMEPQELRNLRPMLKVHVAAPVAPAKTKVAVLQDEADRLDERLTEIELTLVRKEIDKLAERTELGAETAEAINRLRQRLGELQSRLRPASVSCVPLPPQSVSSDFAGSALPTPNGPPSVPPPPPPASPR